MRKESDNLDLIGGDSELFPEKAEFSFEDDHQTPQSSDEFPIPVSPVIHAALRALFTGGPKSRWTADDYGRPFFRYDSRDGSIEFFCLPPPDFSNRFHLSKAYYFAPRLGFIYAGGLWDSVKKFSVETADIFLILMARIAQLRDPQKDIARISLEEISRFRGVRVRHGSSRKLYRDFQEEVLRIADLRMRMTWRDYARGGSIGFGMRRPDRLLDIVDVQYKSDKESWTAFRYRCGQALAHFLNPEGLRWIGYYSRSLLRLSPYHEAFTKKLGTYWILIGIAAGKKGAQPRATPLSILEFCGEDINWRNPGQTLDSFIDSHRRLEELGVLEEALIPEPASRIKGYFRNWLETPITVKLSEQIWKIGSPSRKKLPSLRNRRAMGKKVPQPVLPLNVPESAEEIRENPALIKKFRTDYLLRQADLALRLGLSSQTLSNYERGLRTLPADVAEKVLNIWKKKALLETK